MRRAVALLCAALFLAAPAGAAEPKDPLLAAATGRHAYVFAEFVSRTCPVCREMRPVIEAAVERHRGVLHQIHDADVEVDLAKKYDVKCVPVYVIVDPTGQVRFNDVGTRTPEELDELLQSAGVRRR